MYQLLACRIKGRLHEIESKKAIELEDQLTDPDVGKDCVHLVCGWMKTPVQYDGQIETSLLYHSAKFKTIMRHSRLV